MTKAAEQSGVLTQDLLRSLVDYDPETGRFTRKTIATKPGDGRGRVYTPGQEAGTLTPRGYRRLGINHSVYWSHRLAWFWVYGTWPENDIDHINGEKADNRIANLRDVPRRINAQNRRTAKPSNSTGLLGARHNRANGTFWAQIKVGEKYLFLGSFATPEAAHQAFVKAKRQFHAGCTI